MKYLITLFLGTFFLLFIIGITDKTVFSDEDGPPPGNTGSPADNGSTCNQRDCHDSFDLNAGKAKFSISAPSTYMLGETLTITVFFENTDTDTHGFQLSALNANDKHTGTFGNINDQTQTDGDYINHTLDGIGETSWDVEWTAPSSSIVSPVTFYAAGNEANGNLLPTGDFIYTATATTSLDTGDTGTLEVSPENLKIRVSESDDVTLFRMDGNGDPIEGETITAKINKKGKKRIEISADSVVTDENGEAVFTITGKKKGKAKVKFNASGLKLKLKVKVKE